MTADLDAALESIREYVRSKIAGGFLSIEAIEAEAVDVGSLDAPAAEVRPHVSGIVKHYIEAHLEEQATWPQETDYDRLAAAFAHLEDRGIVARQDFSCCGTCGGVEIRDEMERVASTGPSVRGYTFFHVQGTDTAVDGRGLYLAYGSVAETEAGALAIAREVVATLENSGLSAIWDGSWATCIHVKLDWKRRREG